MTSDGRILSWNSERSSELDINNSNDENYYHCIDYSHSDQENMFACAGALPIIEIYDEITMKRVQFYD